MWSPDPTSEELAAEAREVLRKHPPPEGRELYVWLVRQGIINAKWRLTRLRGGSAEPEPDYQNWVPPDGRMK
jgi:hypothetical protein